MLARHRGNRAQSRPIIRVDTAEDMEVPVPYCGEIPFQHLADYSVFLPKRNQYRDRSLRAPAQLIRIGPRRLAAPGHHVHECDEEIVQPADQDPGRHGNQTGKDPVVQPVE